MKILREFALFTLACAGAAAGQPSYTVTPLPGPGSPIYMVDWISPDATRMIGYAFYPWGTPDAPNITIGQCYVYNNGTFTILATTGFSCEPGRANSKGEFVGNLILSSQTDSKWYAFGYLNGDFVPLRSVLPDQPNMSFATGINDKSEVVGWAWTSPVTVDSSGYPIVVYEVQYGFVYSNGQVRRLPTLGGHMSLASAINNSGDVAGGASDASTPTVPFYSAETQHAVIFHGDQIIDISPPGAVASTAKLINNKGQAAVIAQPKADSYLWTEGYFYDGAELSPIPKLPGTVGPFTLIAMNDSGELIGTQQTADGLDHPFYYFNGRSYDLNQILENAPDGIILSYATTIDNAGRILASARRVGDPTMNAIGMFLLTPVPQAASQASGRSPQRGIIPHR